MYTLGLKGTLGSSTAQAVAEVAFSGSATCLNGNPGYQFELVPGGAAHAVRRYDSTGDLLFFHYTALSVCFDPVTQIQFANGTGEITGGTGRFAEAAGTTEASGTGKALFQDAAGNAFVEVSGTYKDKIITP